MFLPSNNKRHFIMTIKKCHVNARKLQKQNMTSNKVNDQCNFFKAMIKVTNKNL